MESLSSQQDSASDFHSAIDTLSEQDEGTVTPPSKQATPATSPQSSFRWSSLPCSLATEVLVQRTIKLCSGCRIAGAGLRGAEPRVVRLKRIQGELGVQVCGGNLSGIFVESLEDDSPAKGPDGLLPGDLILEVPELIDKVTLNHVGLNKGSFPSWKI